MREMSKINKTVNEIIEGSTDVRTRIMTPKEAMKMGALAFIWRKIWRGSQSSIYGKRI